MVNDPVYTRRQLFKSGAAMCALGSIGMPLHAKETLSASLAAADDRSYWVSVAVKIAQPVLENLARRELKKNMPVEEKPGAKRARFTHLEAFGRLLCGLAPWLAVEDLDGKELELKQEFLKFAQTALDAATDPQSPDYMNFSNGSQPLVDAAFLAQGILRAPKFFVGAIRTAREGPDHRRAEINSADRYARSEQLGDVPSDHRSCSIGVWYRDIGDTGAAAGGLRQQNAQMVRR